MQQDSLWLKYSRSTETLIETVLFGSRWLLAPFYLGLAISIVVLLIKFMVELLHLVVGAFTMTEPEVIVGVLSLVDMALTGSLLIIVIFSGYENFVSRIDHAGHRDWPAWMGTIDFSALKLKLLSSIVAISAIQLLKQFMALNKVSDRDLYFLVLIHVVFVVSSVLLALADRIAGHESSSHDSPANGNGGHGGGAPGEKHDASHGRSEPKKPAAPVPRDVPAQEILIASAEAMPSTPAAASAPPAKSSTAGKKGHK